MTDAALVFGTAEPVSPRRILTAGPLSVVLEGGQLRDIRWHGVLVLRGIAYLLRDANWGTMVVTLEAERIEPSSDRFAVNYLARASVLSYRARIEGTASGRLSFAATARAEGDFVTNRTGFVVLHPDTAAGSKMTVTHTNGAVEETRFPDRIMPDQPAFDIAALGHVPCRGVSALTAFTGGVFEMEDQRNWADASFKTYVRPVAWPRPYTIAAGTEDSQSVTLTLSGRPDPVAAASSRGVPLAVMPDLWLRLDPREPIPDGLCLPGLAQGLILRSGAVPEASRLAAAAELAAREGMQFAVEVALPARDPVAEAGALAGALAAHPPAVVFASLVRDAKTRPSGQVPDGEATAAAIALALSTALPGIPLAMGTPAFFTEFNRNPPPPCDAAFFSVAGTVHAADDASVMETVTVLPEIAASAAACRPGARLIPGPLTIAPTISPYAPALAATDGTTRTCMAAADPRHGALFGAAHLIAVAAALAGRVSAMAPAFATGLTGLQAADGEPLPLAHVHAKIAAAAGRRILRADQEKGMALLLWEGGGIAANVTDQVLPLPEASGTICLRPRGWDASSPSPVLAPFASVCFDDCETAMQ